MNAPNKKQQRINEEIDGKKARDMHYAIMSVINKKRDVGFVDITQKYIKLIEDSHVGILPVRMLSHKSMVGIIYRDKSKALRLLEIAKSHNGFLTDKTAAEAREIGELLGYTKESINEYVWEKYINNSPRTKLDEMDDSFFKKDPFSNFETKYRKEQNQKDIIFFSPEYSSPYVNEAKNVTILKNPQSLEYVEPGVRGVIDSQGNLYIEQDNQLIHVDILNILGKLGAIKYDEAFMGFNTSTMPEYFITVIRLGRSKSFYLGQESGPMIPDDKKWDMYERDVVENMPTVEQARPIYQKFLNAAQGKNPGYKFINEIIGYMYKNTLQESNDSSKLNKKVVSIVKDKGGKSVKICTVNGIFVKGTNPGLGFIQFVEGGHHYVDSYPGYKKNIPEDEIWVDEVFYKTPDNFNGIVGHEFQERNNMKYREMSYDKAHDLSNKSEEKFRGRKEKLNENYQFTKIKSLLGKLRIMLL